MGHADVSDEIGWIQEGELRTVLHPKLIAGRLRSGPFWSDDSHGHNGTFLVLGPHGADLRIIASDAKKEPETSLGWEHVSVSLRNRCPNWPEMCFVKGLFWQPEETVLQFHPPESTWISNHPFCLHLWRNTRAEVQLPPSIMVGIKDAGEIKSPGEAAEVMRRAGMRNA